MEKNKFRILLVVATELELAPLAEKVSIKGIQKSGEKEFENLEIELLVTGPGQMLTSFALSNHLSLNTFDLLINAGIAGAIDKQIPLGEVVQVKSETFGDLGAESRKGALIDIFELGLLNPNSFPFKNGKIPNEAAEQFQFLTAVHGLTVNKVHGKAKSIKKMIAKFPHVQIETMEGAAFFYAATLFKVPFIQVRGISNYVERRNRENWKIGLAVEELNIALDRIFIALDESF